jgi:hypothetical protein
VRASDDPAIPMRSHSNGKVMHRFLLLIGLALISASQDEPLAAKSFFRRVHNRNLQTVALERRRASRAAGGRYRAAGIESAPVACEAIVDGEW